MTGLIRITFPGYTHEQLIKIVQSRLEGMPRNLMDPDAIQFTSRKVAAISGDARRALDICRRAVELVEQSTQNDMPPTPSKSGRHKQGDDGIPLTTGRVTIRIIIKAINEATSSPLQMCL